MNNPSQHLDKSVIFMFLVTFLVSSSVLAYKYMSYTPCELVDFEIKSTNFAVGELVKFNDNTDSAVSWSWDFGDESQVSTLQQAIHVYDKPGTYDVRLLVNDMCDRVEQITINAKKEIIDSTLFPVFDLPKSIMVGQTLRVKDFTAHAESWEWRFGETARANSTKQNATYVYDKPGVKTVSLVVNDDLKYITKKTINVRPKPEVSNQVALPVIKDAPSFQIKDAPKAAQPKDAPKAAPYLSEAQLEIKLKKISKDGASPKTLSEYFCNNLEIQVIANGDKMSFLIFCEKIKSRKIKKIKKLEIFREKGTNCVKTFTIDYSKKGIF